MSTSRRARRRSAVPPPTLSAGKLRQRAVRHGGGAIWSGLAVAGAGFLVVSLGAISFIPGLPVKPAYYKIDVDLSSGSPRVVGLS